MSNLTTRDPRTLHDDDMAAIYTSALAAIAAKLRSPK